MHREVHPNTLAHLGHVLASPVRAVIRPLGHETTEQNFTDNFGRDVA